MSESDTLHASQSGHQRDNVDIASIVKFVIALSVVLALVMVVVAGLMKLFSRPPSPSAQVFPKGSSHVPEPHQQVHPIDDLQALRRREEEQLGTYGWINRDAGVVHIPIDRAMDLIVSEAHRSDATPTNHESLAQ